MDISIITPTAHRGAYLRRLYEGVLAQDFEGEWEWLIDDSSPEPSDFFSLLEDPRVHYVHNPEKMTIGQKRSLLNERTRGDVVVHFDDDDYYAPNYLTKVFGELQRCDFFHFESWFCFDLPSQAFYYWRTDTIEPKHFVLDQKGFRERAMAEDEHFRKSVATGYGFSYSYRQSVAKACPFPPLNWGEDFIFFENVEKGGFSMRGAHDEKGYVLHVTHGKNTSASFPQFRLPSFVGERFFPGFSYET